jgi:hypothetical protein
MAKIDFRFKIAGLVTIQLFEKNPFCFTCGVIPVKTGIQGRNNIWIPAGVYPDANRGRNDRFI